jgi:hypothetical protein
LKKEKVTVSPHPPVFFRTCPMWCLFVSKIEIIACWRKYRSRQALGSAIHQYLITVPKSAFHDTLKKWIHRLKFCISSHGAYFEETKWTLLS